MTNQEAFDRVYRHMLKQGRPSMSATDEKRCAYRGRDGLQCAVGCLIPDSEYNPGLEQFGAYAVAEQVKALTGLDSRLLGELQAIHDQHEPEEWEGCLLDAAEEYGLTVPSLSGEAAK